MKPSKSKKALEIAYIELEYTLHDAIDQAKSIPAAGPLSAELEQHIAMAKTDVLALLHDVEQADDDPAG